jgi:hypothetical protein
MRIRWVIIHVTAKPTDALMIYSEWFVSSTPNNTKLTLPSNNRSELS